MKPGTKKGIKFTEEHKEKIRQSRLGTKASNETKKKMSLKRMGMKFTKEHSEKIRQALIGKKHTEERKNKISEAHKGIKLSDEQKVNMCGINHWNWKGGISGDNLRLRATNKYKQWRLAVYIRDSFTCQNCGEVGGKLNAHHIKSFAKYPKSRFNTDNGVTLCVQCHKLTDNFAGNNK